MGNNFDKEIEVPVDKAINLLNNLIEIPSIKGKKNDDIINFLKRELKELNCHPEVFIADSDKFLNYPEHCLFSERTGKNKNNCN